MRKIDAVILSALVLYDYSAQSLVDSDLMSIGNSFVTEYNSASPRKDKSADLTFLADSYDYDNTFTAKHTAALTSNKGLDGTPSKNISYYELAKINSATSQQAEDHNVLIHISMPDSFLEEPDMFPEIAETATEENSLAFSISTVSASFSALSDAGNIEVKDLDNEGKLQFADTDTDGMFDFEDKCPNISGVARFEGCPVPDSDGDGINDEEDHCPSVPGTLEANGCALNTDSDTPDGNTSDVITEDHNVKTVLTVIQLDKHNEVLTSKDFNKVLQLADRVLHDTKASINILSSDQPDVVKDVNTITQYLKDLGVKDTQINVSVNNSGGNDLVGGVSVQLAY